MLTPRPIHIEPSDFTIRLPEVRSQLELAAGGDESGAAFDGESPPQVEERIATVTAATRAAGERPLGSSIARKHSTSATVQWAEPNRDERWSRRLAPTKRWSTIEP